MANTFKKRISQFPAGRSEAISKVLADTLEGLTRRGINHLLRNCDIPNPTPEMTKWKRLHNAFVAFRNEHQAYNHIIVLVHRAIDPARFFSEPNVFRSRRDHLKPVLAFCGYTLGEDGKLRRADAARTITETLKRAYRLHSALIQRTDHGEMLKCCNAELLEQNHFHAIFEAMKSITAKLRTLFELSGDGCDVAKIRRAMG